MTSSSYQYVEISLVLSSLILIQFHSKTLPLILLLLLLQDSFFSMSLQDILQNGLSNNCALFFWHLMFKKDLYLLLSWASCERWFSGETLLACLFNDFFSFSPFSYHFLFHVFYRTSWRGNYLGETARIIHERVLEHPGKNKILHI